MVFRWTRCFILQPQTNLGVPFGNISVEGEPETLMDFRDNVLIMEKEIDSGKKNSVISLSLFARPINCGCNHLTSWLDKFRQNSFSFKTHSIER